MLKRRKKHQGKERRRYSIEDYKKVNMLRKKGISYNKIAEIVDLSTTTVQMWIKTQRKPRCIYSNKQQRNLSLKSKKMSNNLAYIYGVLVGDGYVEKSKSTNRITLQVTDKEFAKKFYTALYGWSGFKPTWREGWVSQNHRTKYGNLINCDSYFYYVRLGSKQAVCFLDSKSKHRTKNWNVPKDIKNTKNKNFISYFLKGVFDSEGFPVYDSRNNKKRIELEMYGKGVKQLQNLLKKINIESTVTQSKKQKERGMYVLRILRKESIKTFAEKISFNVKRRREKLYGLLSSYK